MSSVTATNTEPPSGIQTFYQSKIEELELTVIEKTQNLRRLEAQRNTLNAKGIPNLPLLFSLFINLNFLEILFSSLIKRRISFITRSWLLCRRSS
jgi:hypothetical protein